MAMMLYSETGRWALLDNSMILSNVAYIMDKKDALKYHLVDDELNDIPIEGGVRSCIMEGFIPPETIETRT